MNLKAVLEGILFVVGKDGITKKEIQEVMDVDNKELDEIISLLKDDYKNSDRGIELEIYGEHLKLVTKKEHSNYYKKMVNNEVSSNLSSSAIEVLAIIAYNPNITRIQIDEIRGVNSTYIVRKLLIKGLIMESGKSDLPGKPNMYKVTDEFLDYLGIASCDELPLVSLEEEKDDEVDLFKSKYKEIEDKNESENR